MVPFQAMQTAERWLYDIRITLRIPAQTEGMVRVVLSGTTDAAWALSRTGRLVLDDAAEGEPKALPLHVLDIAPQELYLRWAKTDSERRVKLDLGMTAAGDEARVTILKDARIGVVVASGLRRESPAGGDLGFTVHDTVQSPQEHLPSGPAAVGVLSLE